MFQRHAEAVEGAETTEDEDLEDSKHYDLEECIDEKDESNSTADTFDSEENWESDESSTTGYSFHADESCEVRNMQGLGSVCGVHD